MKRRNREIVTFSISAIDLFCSGMGAVMLLMVLLMPYYMRPEASSLAIDPIPTKPEPTKPTPVEPVPPKPEPTPPVPVPAPGLRVHSTDVVFVMDATASMDVALESVRTSMRSIVQVLRRLSDDVRVGFVAYIDRSILLSIPLKSVNSTPAGEKNLKDLLRGIKRVRLVGNSDWPEDVNKGLKKAMRMNWDGAPSDSRQLIVVLGDAETHPEDRSSSFDSVKKWVAKTDDRSVHAVNTFAEEGRGSYEHIAALKYFKQIAKLGNGEYIEVKGDLLGVILDILIVR